MQLKSRTRWVSRLQMLLGVLCVLWLAWLSKGCTVSANHVAQVAMLSSV